MLYITSLCSGKKRIGDAVGELAGLGFKNIELTAGTTYYPSIKQELIKMKNKFRINFLIHNYFPPQPEEFVLNPATQDKELKKKTLALIREAISLSNDLGVNLYSLHCGFENDLLPQLKEGFFIKKDNNRIKKEDFWHSLEMIARWIIPSHFKIAIENLCPKTPQDRYSFICHPGEIREFLDYFKHRKNIGILLDLGHLNVAAKRLGFNRDKELDKLLDKYSWRIFKLHLSENDATFDYHQVTAEDSWQIDFLLRHRKKLSGIPITFEWQNSATKPTYEAFCRLQKKVIASS